MPHRPVKPAVALVACATLLSTASPSLATPTTSRGQISVAQVTEMLGKAPTDRMAQQVLTAYLAGVGETAGAVAKIGDVTCQTSMSLNAANVGQALGRAGDRDAVETPATPLIVADMLKRAGCTRH